MSLKHAILAMLSALVLHAAPAAAQDPPLRVVASFSILADLASQIGGDRVTVQSLVGLAYIAEDPLAALCVTESLKVDVLVSRRPFDRLATPL